MSDRPHASDAGSDDEVDLVADPSDPFANLPKPRRGFEIRDPDADAVPAPVPDGDPTPASDR